MSDIIEEVLVPPLLPTHKKLRTLEEAIEHSEKTAEIAIQACDKEYAENALQLAKWLRELKSLRRALNIVPRAVAG